MNLLSTKPACAGCRHFRNIGWKCGRPSSVDHVDPDGSMVIMLNHPAKQERASETEGACGTDGLHFEQRPARQVEAA